MARTLDSLPGVWNYTPLCLFRVVCLTCGPRLPHFKGAAVSDLGAPEGDATVAHGEAGQPNLTKRELKVRLAPGPRHRSEISLRVALTRVTSDKMVPAGVRSPRYITKTYRAARPTVEPADARRVDLVAVAMAV